VERVKNQNSTEGSARRELFILSLTLFTSLFTLFATFSTLSILFAYSHPPPWQPTRLTEDHFPHVSSSIRDWYRFRFSFDLFEFFFFIIIVILRFALFFVFLVSVGTVDSRAYALFVIVT